VFSRSDFSPQVSIVTGGGSGIGLAIAAELVARGSSVVVADIDAAKAQAAATRLGAAATPATLDVADAGAVTALVDGVVAERGRLDVMVNNAGLGHPGAILEGELDKWREMLDVNVVALLVGCKTAVQQMRRCGNGGRIVNISSIAALRPESGVYGATKVAVNHITATLREELEGDDIRITSLMPGVVATNFARNMDADVVAGIAALSGVDTEFVPGQRIPDEVLEKAQEGLATHIAKPDDIADAVHYVVSLPSRLNVPELIVRPAQSLDF
jgi:NADP-dependent 3-hydroxy acid dehydrogenase YdfG